jgi:hypothetical protein
VFAKRFNSQSKLGASKSSLRLTTANKDTAIPRASSEFHSLFDQQKTTTKEMIDNAKLRMSTSTNRRSLASS